MQCSFQLCCICGFLIYKITLDKYLNGYFPHHSQQNLFIYPFSLTRKPLTAGLMTAHSRNLEWFWGFVYF